MFPYPVSGPLETLTAFAIAFAAGALAAFAVKEYVDHVRQEATESPDLP